MKKLMIYGATGYTGRLAAQRAAAAGTPLILAGRNEAALAALAASLGVAYRVFGLDDIAAIDRSLDGVGVLLNCAGPFARTADVLMRACIRHGVHYLDIAAEIDGYHLAETLDAEASAAGVMLLPGSGGSVAMLGCLAAHAVARTSNASRIRVALHVAGGLSRGSAVSAMASVTAEPLARAGGALVARPVGALRKLDFGSGPVDCFPVTLPDLITIWRSTGVPDIEAFVHVTGDGFPQGDLAAQPDGPSEQERLANRYRAVVEVTGADGAIVRSVLDTVNGYTFTAIAAAEAGRRVLAGEHRPGFQTPATLFGNGFAETIADTTIVDVRGAQEAELVDRFIQAANAFDVDGALALFQSGASIDDVSVGEAFVGTDGIRRYLERFFVGYHTASELLSLERLDQSTVIARIDFTGDFGHEIGSLKIRSGADGLIERIDTALE